MDKLGMLGSRPQVNQVFTPRRTEVNRDIYVDRPDLEKELRRSLQGSLNTIVYGESGSGKSWLFKKVLSDLGYYVATANCANALRFNSLTKEIQDVAGLVNPKRLASQEEEMTASANAVVAEGGLTSRRHYEIAQGDPLLECFSAVRRCAGREPAVLVIDNLEMIFDSKPLMDELASIITVLDDPRYAQYNVRLLLVGVPSEIKDYFLQNHSSVANRLNEISEVSSLTRRQVAELVKKGFEGLLRIRFPEGLLESWQTHIYNVTMGFAQHVQEYCEQLGYIVEDNDWSATLDQLKAADRQWLKGGLNHASGAIESLMNERETKIGRRNQVLYVLGKLDSKTFHITEIETLLREEFPSSTANVQLAVGQMLAELSGGRTPIIKRSPKGGSYQFRDARFAMAVRALLQKDPTRERVFIAK
jgi:hypothetical protein